MSNKDVLIPISRHLPLSFYKSRFEKILINLKGLVVNNVNIVEGRGNYFPGVSGTTEGCLLLARGVADAYRTTGDPGWLFLLQRLVSGLEFMFAGQPVAHWLFSVKAPFVGEKPHYTRAFTFTAGVAVIPRELGGGLTKTIYHVRSSDSEYLWLNPYSVLKAGSFYPIHYTLKNDNKTTTVALTNTGFNGTAYIMYTTLEGEVIQKNDNFEAWPYWRRLEPGEVNIAMDSIAWSIDTYEALLLATGDTAYQDKIDAVAAKVLELFDVNDGRAWITRRLVNPLQVAGSFTYTEVTGLVVDKAPDGSIIFAMPTIPAHGGSEISFGLPAWYDISLGITEPSLIANNWTSEVQFGRAVTDVILAADTVWVSMTASRALTVVLFIDTANTYSDATRFLYTASLVPGDNSLMIPTASFKNLALTSLAVGAAIYDVGWSIRHTHLASVSPFELRVHEIRPLPHVPLTYMPGICPFTSNYLYGEPVGWRGPIYTGYQDPLIWDHVTGHEAKAEVVLNFLIASQAAYTATYPSLTGPFAPVYYLSRYDSVEYGAPGTFGWDGPDPNTRWEGYQYRPLFDTARYLAAHPTSTKALQIVSAFITYLNGAFDDEFGFPSDYPGNALPQHNYFSAHALFIVMGAAIYFEQSGHGTLASQQLLTKAAAMAVERFDGGIWAPNNADWFGFWNGVILIVLSLIKELELDLFTDDQLTAFFEENQYWLNKHTEGF